MCCSVIEVVASDCWKRRSHEYLDQESMSWTSPVKIWFQSLEFCVPWTKAVCILLLILKINQFRTKTFYYFVDLLVDIWFWEFVLILIGGVKDTINMKKMKDSFIELCVVLCCQTLKWHVYYLGRWTFINFKLKWNF